jgi:hypothetical protein
MPKPDQESTGSHEWEGEHFKATWRETEETLHASITHGSETVLFTYTPKSKKVEVVFGNQAQPEATETSESEYPPFTIEGYLSPRHFLIDGPNKQVDHAKPALVLEA